MTKAMVLQVTNTNGLREYFEGILRMSQSDEKFPADLDDVWHLAYKDRRSATRALHKFYIEGHDYEILLHRNVKQTGRGGSNIKIYKLTAASLEYFVARKNRAVFEVYSKVFHKAVQIDPMKALNDPAAMRSLLLNYSEKVLLKEVACVKEREGG